MGLLRAPKTAGKESLVITTHSRLPSHHPEHAVSGLGIGLALLRYLSRNPHRLFLFSRWAIDLIFDFCCSLLFYSSLKGVNWLSKDILFVVTDERFGNEAAKRWLQEYHFGNQVSNSSSSPNFLTGGKIRAALSLDFYTNNADSIAISPCNPLISSFT